MDALRQKLNDQGLVNVTYMVVNSQHEASRHHHHHLRENMSQNITLHAQDPQQPDVWKTLSGVTDDFLVYDRCGRLTYHICLPYSNLSAPYVENAIRESYCNSVCGNCSSADSEEIEACKKPEEPEGLEKSDDETVPSVLDLSQLPWRRYGHGAHVHGHKHGHKHGHVDHGHGHSHGHDHIHDRSQDHDQPRYSGIHGHEDQHGHRLQLELQEFLNIHPQLNRSLPQREVLHLPIQQQRGS